MIRMGLLNRNISLHIENFLIDFLLVGGGGAGSVGFKNADFVEEHFGYNFSAGGGAGAELIEVSNYLINIDLIQKYPIIIGKGGIGTNLFGNGANGTYTSFKNYVSYGGPGGGWKNGLSGTNGSGAGGGGLDYSIKNIGGAGGSTYNGGSGYNGGNAGGIETPFKMYVYGGGGAGAGGAGGAGNGNTIALGGVGKSSTIFNNGILYGNGGSSTLLPIYNIQGTSGLTYGSGGSAGYNYTNTSNEILNHNGIVYGGSGKDGILILRYITANFPTMTGGTITTDGIYTIHTFTENGVFKRA